MKDEQSGLLEQIRDNLLHKLTENDVTDTTIPGVGAIRKENESLNAKCFEAPLAILGVQALKKIHTSEREFNISPGVLMVSCIDAPSTSSILNASPGNPFLALYFHLDRNILADLFLQLAETPVFLKSVESTAWASNADALVLDAFLRLTRLLGDPPKALILGPMIIRELHFLLLTGPGGKVLRQLYARGGRDRGLMDVITWLKKNTRESCSMNDLAQMAKMSLSSFHRHFKSLTGLSPLQYHKKIRLFAAQRMMLVEGKRATEAATEVGYESITQFNREYKRLFGAPPARDISNLKRKLGVAS